MLDKIRCWARKLMQELNAIYIASKDPRTPLKARVLALGVVAYALSPIDLIPDFIPVLGLVDDLIIVPIGIALIIRLIPKPLMTSYRLQARAAIKLPTSRNAAIVVIAIWLCVAALITSYVVG